MRTILFICTGNTCRSPLAQAIAQHYIDDGVLAGAGPTRAVSAGVAAVDGAEVSPKTVTALGRTGIAFSGHSKRLSPEMIRSASVVFCMTESHVAAARAIVANDSDHVSKVHLLDPDGAIEDPLGFPQQAYDELSRKFMGLIPRRLEEILG